MGNLKVPSFLVKNPLSEAKNQFPENGKQKSSIEHRPEEATSLLNKTASHADRLLVSKNLYSRAMDIFKGGLSALLGSFGISKISIRTSHAKSNSTESPKDIESGLFTHEVENVQASEVSDTQSNEGVSQTESPSRPTESSFIRKLCRNWGHVALMAAGVGLVAGAPVALVALSSVWLAVGLLVAGAVLVSVGHRGWTNLNQEIVAQNLDEAKDNAKIIENNIEKNDKFIQAAAEKVEEAVELEKKIDENLLQFQEKIAAKREDLLQKFGTSKKSEKLKDISLKVAEEKEKLTSEFKESVKAKREAFESDAFKQKQALIKEKRYDIENFEKEFKQKKEELEAKQAELLASLNTKKEFIKINASKIQEIIEEAKKEKNEKNIWESLYDTVAEVTGVSTLQAKTSGITEATRRIQESHAREIATHLEEQIKIEEEIKEIEKNLEFKRQEIVKLEEDVTVTFNISEEEIALLSLKENTHGSVGNLRRHSEKLLKKLQKNNLAQQEALEEITSTISTLRKEWDKEGLDPKVVDKELSQLQQELEQVILQNKESSEMLNDLSKDVHQMLHEFEEVQQFLSEMGTQVSSLSSDLKHAVNLSGEALEDIKKAQQLNILSRAALSKLNINLVNLDVATAGESGWKANTMLAGAFTVTALLGVAGVAALPALIAGTAGVKLAEQYLTGAFTEATGEPTKPLTEEQEAELEAQQGIYEQLPVYNL